MRAHAQGLPIIAYSPASGVATGGTKLTVTTSTLLFSQADMRAAIAASQVTDSKRLTAL